MHEQLLIQNIMYICKTYNVLDICVDIYPGIVCRSIGYIKVMQMLVWNIAMLKCTCVHLIAELSQQVHVSHTMCPHAQFQTLHMHR